MTVLMESAMTAQDIAAVVNVDETTIHGSAQKEDLPGFDGSSKSRIQRPVLQSWIQAPSFSPKGIDMTPYPGGERITLSVTKKYNKWPNLKIFFQRQPSVAYCQMNW